MATRLQFIRSSLLSRQLCRSSQSVSQLQCINNRSVSARNMSASKGASSKCLQMDTINPCIKEMEYAVRYLQDRYVISRFFCGLWVHLVTDLITFSSNILIRGPLVIRATAIEKELEQVNEPSVTEYHSASLYLCINKRSFPAEFSSAWRKKIFSLAENIKINLEVIEFFVKIFCRFLIELYEKLVDFTRRELQPESALSVHCEPVYRFVLNFSSYIHIDITNLVSFLGSKEAVQWSHSREHRRLSCNGKPQQKTTADAALNNNCCVIYTFRVKCPLPSSAKWVYVQFIHLSCDVLALLIVAIGRLSHIRR